MNIRKSHFSLQIFSIACIVCILSFPAIVNAVSIGDVVLQSKLGEPLFAEVDLIIATGEHIDDTCLSLISPDPKDADTSGYVTKANLSIKTEGRRHYVTISSNRQFNDAFARLRLQIKCADSGTSIKTLTILPELEIASQQEPVTAPVVSANEDHVSAPLPPETTDVAAASRPADISPVASPSVSGKNFPSVIKRHRPAAGKIRRQHGQVATFRLKLSGDPIDESRIGKITPEERAVLLARQKLLDADDQMASFLSMQNQVKQLQNELGEIKLQMTQLGMSPASSSVQPSAASLTESGKVNAPAAIQKSTSFWNLSALKLVNPDLQNKLLFALGLLLSIFALWLGLRFYNKTKSYPAFETTQDSEFDLSQPALNAATDPAAFNPAPPAAVKPSAPLVAKVKSDPVSTVAETNKPVASKSEPAPLSSSTKPAEDEVTEEDSMMEEAGLYATHGRPAKAIEILQEIIQRQPSNPDPWPLLFSIYSSLGKAAEFENTAQEFLKHHKDSTAWSGIRALGRTFDQNNPLYADNNSPISDTPFLPDSATSRRPVGDVLLEMGALSNQDLQNCLDNYDPKRHGRFGGYLVARKAITLAQLDHALLKQQGIDDEEKTDSLPSLQDMEKFLADFDPKRDNSIGEFLSARNIATPEQLSQLLQQNSNFTEESGEETAYDPSAPIDFVLETTSKVAAPEPEPESSWEIDKPLDFEVESASVPFPEINLEMGTPSPPRKKPDFG